MGIEAFVLRGPFTPDDMARFVAVLREIDSGDPAKHYELVAVDSNLTGLETAAKLLKQAVTPVPGRVTRFAGWPSNPEVWVTALAKVLRLHLSADGVGWKWEPPNILSMDGGRFNLRKVVMHLFTEVAGAETHDQ